jgi:hypothetical protein
MMFTVTRLALKFVVSLVYHAVALLFDRDDRAERSSPYAHE